MEAELNHKQREVWRKRLEEGLEKSKKEEEKKVDQLHSALEDLRGLLFFLLL